MGWGKSFADAWNSAGDAARSAARAASQGMQAAGELATSLANAAKRTASAAVERGIGAAKAVGDKVADTYQWVKRDFSLRQAANVPVQGCNAGLKLGDLDCSGLASEESRYEQAQSKAKLAAAVYQDPGHQDLPAGWSRATDADLRVLGLMDKEGRKLTEIPNSDFRADVFKGPAGKYVVAFKGTTSLEDWKNNVQQGMGNRSDYYDRAMKIAERVHAMQPENVEYVGHSLGGGLASVAAAMYGSPATTFNAAGLNDKTLARKWVVPETDNIDAYYVDGDILSGVQDRDLGLLPKGAGERILLSPADSVTWADVQAEVVTDAVAGPLLGVVAGAGARGVRLHGMDSVEAALVKRMGQLGLLQKEKGCN